MVANSSGKFLQGFRDKEPQITRQAFPPVTKILQPPETETETETETMLQTHPPGFQK